MAYNTNQHIRSDIVQVTWPSLNLFKIYKKENNITILQPGRWEEIIKDRVGYGHNQGLSDDLLGEILKLIHQESIRHQTKVMNEEASSVKENQ